MNRKAVLVATLALFGLGSASAHADSNRHLRYVVGGAILGAVAGELVYSSRRDSRVHVYQQVHYPQVHYPHVYHPAVVYTAPQRKRAGRPARHYAAPVAVVAGPPGLARRGAIPPGHLRRTTVTAVPVYQAPATTVVRVYGY
jgi:hypothetical protein